MDRDRLIAEIRSMRARGVTPKMIAKALGIPRAVANEVIREIAREAASAESAVVGCWVNPGWSEGLSWAGHPDWEDDAETDRGDGLPSLVTVLVVREHRYEKVSAYAYLVDAQCLGVKNVIGPRLGPSAELGAMIERQFSAYDEPPLRASLELARELVFGAEAYARRLGFEPHRDFDACRGHLGPWTGPGQITFGYHGKPMFMRGPNDDATKVTATLERSGQVTTSPERPVRMDESRPIPVYSRDIPLMSVDRRIARLPADVRRGRPEGLLSAALLDVMEPYIPWPPAADELGELGEELCFGATVWNATVQSTEPAKTTALLEAVVGMFSTGDPVGEASLRTHVAEIAERKRCLHADDPRQIVRVDIVPNGGNVEVLAMSAWYEA